MDLHELIASNLFFVDSREDGNPPTQPSTGACKRESVDTMDMETSVPAD